MAVFDNLNYSYSAGIAPGLHDYIFRKLMERQREDLVHGRDAQKRALPQNNGKRAQFRRMTPLPIKAVPLIEGKSAEGQPLTMTELWVAVKSYGGHVEITDEMDLYQIDNMTQETANLLNEQAVGTIDEIEREAFNAGLNVQYANGKATRTALTSADKLTFQDIKKAVRTLERKKAKVFSDGFYHAIVSPDVVFDLTSDPLWVDVAKYQDKQKVDKYELGTIYKVKFFKANNAKTFEAPEHLIDTTVIYGTAGHTVNSLTISAYDAAKRQATVTKAQFAGFAEDEIVNNLVGRVMDVSAGSTKYPVCVEKVDIEGANVLVTFRWQAADTSAWDSATLVPYGGASSGDTVYSTLIYGQDAFGDIELEGHGKNVQIIINPPGSSGAADPEAQRGTIAWKVMGFGAAILQDDFVVRLESGATE